MKKFLALLCSLLLLTAAAASAESAPVVEFNGLQLGGTLPEGYTFFQISRSESALEGEFRSGDPAAPVLKVYIAAAEAYAGKESLKDLDDETLTIIKQGFSDENTVSFDTLDTASGISLLVIRDIGSDQDFVDFYTVSRGCEIELTLCASAGSSVRTLTEEQITRCTELMRSLTILGN